MNEPEEKLADNQHLTDRDPEGQPLPKGLTLERFIGNSALVSAGYILMRVSDRFDDTPLLYYGSGGLVAAAAVMAGGDSIKAMVEDYKISRANRRAQKQGQGPAKS